MRTPRQKLERSSPDKKISENTVYLCEAEVAVGLEDIARDELIHRLGKRVRIEPVDYDGIVRFRYKSDLRQLFALRTVQSMYLVHFSAVPRPRALLGHEHFHKLLQHIILVLSLHPPGTFRSFHLDAAGSDSAVMTRLKNELAIHTGLILDEESGDLLLRLRRPPDGSDGWETLIRLSPRPLATRSWRICNFEGALNATVAHAMVLMTNPQPDHTFLNIACGSGSILIERLSAAPVRQAIGCDLSPVALACAATNIAASGNRFAIGLIVSDGQSLPFADSSIDAICADLPFGQRVGSHSENQTLYPGVLQEAGRVARPDAHFAVITHEVRLMETVLSRSTQWQIERIRMITLRGLHPRIFVLRKR